MNTIERESGVLGFLILLANLIPSALPLGIKIKREGTCP